MASTTLDADRFRVLTRGGDLDRVLRGIAAAERVGLRPIKLNVVLMGGENDDEIADFVRLTADRAIIVRFIELMPIGESAAWERSSFIPAHAVLAACPTLQAIGDGGDGVAQVYQLPGGVGKVGLISPMSRDFCGRCNRVRVTADGKLKPCLHGADEIDLRGLTDAALEDTMRAGILGKPARHNMTGDRPSESGRPMHQIGG